MNGSIHGLLNIMKNIVPNNIEEMSVNSICLGTPRKHPGNTQETPGKHPGNTIFSSFFLGKLYSGSPTYAKSTNAVPTYVIFHHLPQNIHLHDL